MKQVCPLYRVQFKFMAQFLQPTNQPNSSVVFACNKIEYYRESRLLLLGMQLSGRGLFACRKLGTRIEKTKQHGFCGKCATRRVGHAFLFAEQGNRVRIPDTERRLPYCLQPANLKRRGARQNSQSSCISKVLFSVQRNLCAVKTGHWKSCHGSARRLKQCVCARELPAHEWISQKTYKPRNEELAALAAAFHIRRPFDFASEPRDTRHKGDGYYNHRFFDRKNYFHPYRAARDRSTSPNGGRGEVTTHKIVFTQIIARGHSKAIGLSCDDAK